MHMSVIENSFKVVHFVSEPLVYFSAGGCVKFLNLVSATFIYCKNIVKVHSSKLT